MDNEKLLELRPARAGDGARLFEITQLSVAGLARGAYSPAQIEGWMGARTAATYEGLIARGGVVVAEREGVVVGFVDAEPGEVTRLFLVPDAAGAGLGARLLDIGIGKARLGHAGPVKVEATVNAEGFYRRHGFRAVAKGYFSHGIGSDPIEIVHMELGAPADPLPPS
ncbi:GNAT family acetyltransferase [Ancylobacter aquaticus]|uniref:GNAT family acetyltransferase n=1 Tax=Ancylobacter aquaticus TaxID=100 RepID=A0A4R1I4J3_ANCAQ|nr:GNAT family N-acetyltransferase [Ancylobacter aquaticus]TCK28933.1 GNAT family acetyltransferase [Ancylobacter aquaticus]